MKKSLIIRVLSRVVIICVFLTPILIYFWTCIENVVTGEKVILHVKAQGIANSTEILDLNVGSRTVGLVSLCCGLKKGQIDQMNYKVSLRSSCLERAYLNKNIRNLIEPGESISYTFKNLKRFKNENMIRVEEGKYTLSLIHI